MRYPVGQSTQDFKENWYIASFFGEWRGSYYHSGDDYNLKTRGDSDLGEPLHAIADGVIVGIDDASTTGFGKQIFLKFKVKNRTFYAMYAHCESVQVRTGQNVNEGDQVGTLGKTGTNFAHLHFSIKNKANGMDNVPNTKEELKEWENPTAFLESHIKEGLPVAENDGEFINLKKRLSDRHWSELIEFEQLRERGAIERADSIQTIVQKFLDKYIWQKREIENLEQEVKEQLDRAEGLSQRLADAHSQTCERDKTVTTRDNNINQLKTSLKTAEEQIVILKKENKKLEKKLKFYDSIGKKAFTGIKKFFRNQLSRILQK